MHTTVIRQREQGGAVAPGDVRIHHNGDWSGDAEVQWSNEDRGVVRATIPGWVAEALVAADEPVYDGEMHHISAAHASMDAAGRITLHPDAVYVTPEDAELEVLREINREVAKMPTPSEMTAAASEHPAPWRWERYFYIWQLLDAKTTKAFDGDSGDGDALAEAPVDDRPGASARVRALIEAAPELEAIAKKVAGLKLRSNISIKALRVTVGLLVEDAAALLAQIESKSRG